jgi:hypothetical protein
MSSKKKQSAKVTCKQCGVVFTAYAKRALIAKRRKYCDACLSIRRAVNVESTCRAEKERECEICGTLFLGSTSKKYCSDECRREAKIAQNRAYRNKLNSPAIECAECGKKFKRASGGPSAYCSDKCRNTARNRRVRNVVDPKWLRRWGDKRTYIGKADCFTGALV